MQQAKTNLQRSFLGHASYGVILTQRDELTPRQNSSRSKGDGPQAYSHCSAQKRKVLGEQLGLQLAKSLQTLHRS